MIYKITPDPEWTDKLHKTWTRHMFWQRVRSWIQFWSWHKTKPWIPDHKREWWHWWEKPLEPRDDL